MTDKRLTSRIIKFRAWDVAERRWLDATEFSVRLSDGEIIKLAINHTSDAYWFEFGDVILQQFTGLLDKNGKEIYEGDILRYEYPAGYSLCEVRFGEFDNGQDYEDNKHGNGWYVIDRHHYKSSEDYETVTYFENSTPHMYGGWEVIGNIFETSPQPHDAPR